MPFERRTIELVKVAVVEIGIVYPEIEFVV